MLCEQVTQTIEQYLEGETSGDALNAFGDHTATCATCAEAIQDAIHLVGSIEAVLQESAPSSDARDSGAKQVLAAIAQEPKTVQGTNTSRISFWKPLAMAAVFLFCLGILASTVTLQMTKMEKQMAGDDGVAVSLELIPGRSREGKQNWVKRPSPDAPNSVVFPTGSTWRSTPETQDPGVRTATFSGTIEENQRIIELAQLEKAQLRVFSGFNNNLEEAQLLASGTKNGYGSFGQGSGKYDVTRGNQKGRIRRKRVRRSPPTATNTPLHHWFDGGIDEPTADGEYRPADGPINPGPIHKETDIDAGQGELQARGKDGKIKGLFPLKHTDVKADIAGFLASTKVTQTYENSFDYKIEAVYVFPLPQTAAVNAFMMKVGERKIIGVIKERSEARRMYEQARQAGVVASLLEQERPNIFTQSVANIEPGKKIDIEITYFHTLPYDAGTYTYAFPMVVGHRYGGTMPVPSTPTGLTSRGGGSGMPVPAGGGGQQPDTVRVPDQSRVTPPRKRPNTRSGHDIAMTISLDSGVALESIDSDSHDVAIGRSGNTKATIVLNKKDSIPNRDFVLTYKVAGDENKFGLLTHAGKNGGFFTLQIEPPLQATDAQAVPRELFFILDTSGSMNGVPLNQSKKIMRRALKAMRSNDVFNIATFAGDTLLYSQNFLSSSTRNIGAAIRYVNGLNGRGGTEMQKGVELALNHPRNPNRIRMVVFLTDGHVSFEGDIHQRIKTSASGARIFTFGIGSSPNRFLLDRMAEFGNGYATTILNNEPRANIERKVKMFYQRIDAPVLVDVKLDFGDLPVTDVFPKRIPDVFVGKPVTVHGRFSGEASGNVTVKGLAGGSTFTHQVAMNLPAYQQNRQAENQALEPVWARMKIKTLMDSMVNGNAAARKELTDEVRQMGLDFNLVTSFTSFVAVDSASETTGGAPVRVMQPVEVPAGMDGAVFGLDKEGQAFDLSGWGLIVAENASGHIVVLKVAPGTAAARAGIQTGATVEVYEGTKVTGIKHLGSLIMQQAKPIPAKLKVRQSGKLHDVTVP